MLNKDIKHFDFRNFLSYWVLSFPFGKPLWKMSFKEHMNFPEDQIDSTNRGKSRTIVHTIFYLFLMILFSVVFINMANAQGYNTPGPHNGGISLTGSTTIAHLSAGLYPFIEVAAAPHLAPVALIVAGSSIRFGMLSFASEGYLFLNKTMRCCHDKGEV